MFAEVQLVESVSVVVAEVFQYDNKPPKSVWVMYHNLYFISDFNLSLEE